MSPHAFPRFLGLSLLAVTLLAAAASPIAAAVVKDATGRDVSVSDFSRVVSVGGAVTEILYGLGLEKNIVGIDTTSLYPPRAAAEKPSVGYMRQLSAEGVLGLRPTVILAIDGSARRKPFRFCKRHKSRWWSCRTHSAVRESSRRSTSSPRRPAAKRAHIA